MQRQLCEVDLNGRDEVGELQIFTRKVLLIYMKKWYCIFEKFAWKVYGPHGIFITNLE